MELLELVVLLRVIAPLPIQVGDFVRRANLGGGITMAIKAECHAEWLGVVNFIHLIDLGMAFDATNAAVDVDRVVEVNKIGNAMDLNPFNRLTTGRAFANERQTWVVLEDLIMAVHTSGT